MWSTAQATTAATPLIAGKLKLNSAGKPLSPSTGACLRRLIGTEKTAGGSQACAAANTFLTTRSITRIVTPRYTPSDWPGLIFQANAPTQPSAVDSDTVLMFFGSGEYASLFREVLTHLQRLNTSLPEVLELQPKVIRDARGFFLEA